MHYKIVAINKDFDLTKYDKYKKTNAFLSNRYIGADCKFYEKYLKDLAYRSGMGDLEKFKQKLGKVVYDTAENKLFMINDLDKYDDVRIDHYINTLLRAKNKAYYQLLPLLLRPLGSHICHDDVCIIADGLERIQDNYDNDSDLIIDLLELCYYARDNDCMLYFEFLTAPPPSINTFLYASVFTMNYGKKVLLPNVKTLLLGYKKSDNE